MRTSTVTENRSQNSIQTGQAPREVIESPNSCCITGLFHGIMKGLCCTDPAAASSKKLAAKVRPTKMGHIQPPIQAPKKQWTRMSHIQPLIQAVANHGHMPKSQPSGTKHESKDLKKKTMSMQEQRLASASVPSLEDTKIRIAKRMKEREQKTESKPETKQSSTPAQKIASEQVTVSHKSKTKKTSASASKPEGKPKEEALKSARMPSLKVTGLERDEDPSPAPKPASSKSAVERSAKGPEPKPEVQEPAKNPELKLTAERPEPILEAPKPTQTPELEPEVEAPQPTQVKPLQSEFKLIFNPPEVEAPMPVSEISELGCVDELPALPQPLVDQKPEPSTPRGVVFRSISSDSSPSLSSELPAPILSSFPEEQKDTAQPRPKRNVKRSPASKPSEKPIIPQAPSLESFTLSEKPITFVADLESITQQKRSLKAPKPIVQEEPQAEKSTEMTSNPEKMQSLAPPKRKDSDPEPVLGLITRTPEQMKAIVASQHQSASDSNNSAWEDSSSDKDKSEKKG